MGALFGWYIKHSIPLEQRTKLIDFLVDESTKLGMGSWGYATPGTPGKVSITRGLGKMYERVNIATLATSHIGYGLCHRDLYDKDTIKTTQPFCVNHIVGACDGDVHNHAQLNQMYSRSCTVDVQHLFHHLANKLSIRTIEGSGAAWFIKRHEPDKLYLFKDRHHLAVWGIGSAKECDGVVFASLNIDAQRSIEIAGLQGFEYNFEPGRLFYIHNYTLWTTDTRMAFGEFGYGNPYGSDYWESRDHYHSPWNYSTPRSTPIPRHERLTGWEDIASMCPGCTHAFLHSVLTDGVCPDCVRLANANR